MNLVQDIWLPCRLQDGSVQDLSVADIVRTDVVEFALPRADFQGAAYQLLIALLQTLIAPKNATEWHDLYSNPPTPEQLQQHLNKVAHAFNLVGDGALFMQDFDKLEEANISSISGLLIDAPGENGIKNNTDHFVKRGSGEVLSLTMAVLALFTLQINAPAGGQGHRVGLRGGGPLTTLLLPKDEHATLWQKIWLNVICRDVWIYEDPDLTSAKVFPWLGATKISKGANTELYANEIHPLAMYWAMPRRIRLEVNEGDATCQITGKPTKSYVTSYRTQNYGNNYSGAWFHPLTAYRYDPKKPDEIPNSAKAQPGGITYRYWDLLTFTKESLGQTSSFNIENFYRILKNRKLKKEVGETPRMWCFGYDMKNMDARGWYDASYPLFDIELEDQDDYLLAIKGLQELINKFRLELNKRIKEAWGTKGDIFIISIEFWQRTENIFFTAAHNLSLQDNYFALSTETAATWLASIQRTVINLFDEYTLSVDIGEPRTLKRVMQARKGFIGWVSGYKGKEIKNFKQQHGIETKQETV